MKIVSKKAFLFVSFGFTNQTQILYDQNLHKIHLQKESKPHCAIRQLSAKQDDIAK